MHSLLVICVICYKHLGLSSSDACFLHSKVTVYVVRQVLSVEQEVVADNVESQAGAPVGKRMI